MTDKNKQQAWELFKNFPIVSASTKQKMLRKMRQYIIYDGDKARCTSCGAVLKRSDVTDSDAIRCGCAHMIPLGAVHRKETFCPECGTDVTFIASYHRFSGYVVEDEANYMVFLHGTKGDRNLYISCYNVRVAFERFKLEPKYIFSETQRYIFTEKQAFRFGRYCEWCGMEHRQTEKWELRVNLTEPVFLRNVKEYYTVMESGTISGTYMENSCVDLYLHQERFAEKKTVEYLRFYQRHHGCEQLVKCGFGGMIFSQLQKYGRKYDIDWKQTEPHKMLRVTKDVFRAIRDGRIGYDAYFGTRDRFPDAPLEKLISYNNIVHSCYGVLDQCVEITGSSEKTILKYLRRQDQRINEYRDYLEAAQRLKYDLTARIVLFPPNLLTAHNRCSEQIYLIEKNRKEEERRKLDKALGRLKEERLKYEYSAAGFRVMLPKSITDIVAEGAALNHCVGSYAARHAHGKLTILFIRKESEPDKPLYTAELSIDGTVKQVRGMKNCDPDPAAKQFMEIYKQYLSTVFNRKERKRSA